MVEYVLSKGDIAVATLRKPEVLADLNYPPDRLYILKLDVTKPQDIKDAFAEVEKQIGRLDVVYSNSAAGSLGEIEGTPDDVARDQFEVCIIARES